VTIVIDRRSDLTLETARRVAWSGEGVSLGPNARRALAEGRDRLHRILEHDPEVVIRRHHGRGPARQAQAEARGAQGLGQDVAGRRRLVLG